MRTVGGMDSNARASTASDLFRQITVIAAVCFMIVAAMVGTGLFGGTNVRELQGGALDADATVLAPGRPAFGIWTVIYVLMVAYAVWQALPSQRTRSRQRVAGWWVAATAVLNGAWLLTAQFLNLPATVLAIIVLLVALAGTLRVLQVRPAEGIVDRLLLDGTVGLHLGWVSLATVANITAWLAADVVAPMDADAAAAWGVGVLVVVALIGAAIGWRTGRIAPGLAMAWGLVWIGVERTTGEPQAVPVAIAAWIAAAVVLIVSVVIRVGRGPAPSAETERESRAAAE